MALFLEITEGAQKGTRFQIANGLRIGRVTGEILLDDPKVSSFHAQFEADPRGNLNLVDRNSSNGLHISGQQVRRIRMLPGVRFRIGKTHFVVIKDDSVPELAVIENSDSDGASKDLRWLKTLKKRLSTLLTQNQINPENISAFSRPIELVFVQGLQLHQRIALGYGPRAIGRDGLDIEILEPSCPDIAFELMPQKDFYDPSTDGATEGVFFKTRYPQVVLLNGENCATGELKNRDRIQIGATVIEVNIL